MPKDDRDVLEVLQAELDFIEKGGYGRSVRTPWKSTAIFVDSPSCINFGDREMRQPCNDCLLMQFVPPGNRPGSAVPCHHILLNERAETVESLTLRNNQQRLETAVTEWLRGVIRHLEGQRSHTPPEAGRTADKKRLLVVDDDEKVLLLLEALLENEGYDVTTAWSGFEALGRLRAPYFDIILLDDYLPDMATEEILRQFQEQAPGTPVLLMQTSAITDELVARYAGLGAHYLAAKSHPAYVAALVPEFLNQARLQSSPPQARPSNPNLSTAIHPKEDAA
ncbi:MAG TPA: response regulator [Terriglobia bacterium]|nr:response regulator [Terriglobia bacterium]